MPPAPPDSLKLHSLSYDSISEVASFTFVGSRAGKPIMISGNLRVPTPGDQTESQVTAASKAAIKQILHQAADSI